MAESYDIHLTDPLSAAFTVRAFTSNGTIFPTVDTPLNATAVGANTSLLVFGKGHPEYGERVNENILHILENFSGSTEPKNPVSGQLWYERFIVIRVGSNFYEWTDGVGWGVSFTLTAATLPDPGSVLNGAYALDLSDDLWLAVNDPSHPLSPTWLPRVFEDRTGAIGSLLPRKVLKIYTGTEWKVANSIQVSETSPTDPTTGDLWYNSAIPQLEVYNGSAFVSVAELYLPLDGSSAMTDDLNMSAGSPQTFNKIINLADPDNAQDATTMSWVQAAITTGGTLIALNALTDVTISAPGSTHFLKYDGAGQWRNVPITLVDVGVGALAAQVDWLGGGTTGGQAVSSNVQDQLDGRLKLIGGTLTGGLTISAGGILMTGNELNMGGGLLTNLNDPNNLQDAATKNYVLSQVGGASISIENLVDVTYIGTGSPITPSFGQVLTYNGVGWNNTDNIHTHESSSITHTSSQPYLRDAFFGSYPSFVLDDIIENIIGDFSNRLNIAEAFDAREVFTSVGGSPGQTIFTFTDGSYTVASNKLAVYVNGIKQYANERARQRIDFDSSKNLSNNSLLGLSASTPGSPPIVNTYHLNVAVDGNLATVVEFSLDDASTISDLITQLNNGLVSSGSPITPTANAIWNTATSSLTIHSRTTGNGSSIDITDGAVDGILTALSNVAVGSPADPELPVINFTGSPVASITPPFPSNVTQITADLSYVEAGDVSAFAGTVARSIEFNLPQTAGAVIEMISTGV